ncbi:MAG: LuxR C-terminal-related transcriptional regulator [Cyanobacteriota bacterium]|nr:LuxR C-terminal-related transcriptional regulator [Cyanobacteriota bacterium]
MRCVSNPVAVHPVAASEQAIPISRAEQRVLKLLLKGLGNGAIATTLNLSRRTVEGHVSALFRKTGCHSRTQLVLWALAQG